MPAFPLQIADVLRYLPRVRGMGPYLQEQINAIRNLRVRRQDEDEEFFIDLPDGRQGRVRVVTHCLNDGGAGDDEEGLPYFELVSVGDEAKNEDKTRGKMGKVMNFLRSPGVQKCLGVLGLIAVVNLGKYAINRSGFRFIKSS